MEKRKKVGRIAPLAVPATAEEMTGIATGKIKALSIREMKRAHDIKGDATIYEWTHKGLLPLPRKIGGCSRWLYPAA